MIEQLRADGSLRHLLTLETLDRRQIERLLERAQSFVRPLGERPPRSRLLEGATVANLFTEPSTRTRVSMLDTIYTLQSLHVDALVIRDAEPGVPALAAAHVAPHVSVLSGGEAHVSHPTQGLLDALTVYQHKQRFAGLAIAIVGDIRHSRVARSAWHAFSKLGVSDLRLAAPATLMPEREEFAGCSRHTELASALAGADVIMMLRIQRERISEAHLPVGEQYFGAWGLTRERLALSRPDAIVMHPQPMNRGIEIASDVADGPQSVIRDQVRNGVAVRMAALAEVLSELPR